MVEIDFSGRGFFHNVLSINPRYGAGVEIVDTYREPKHKTFHSIIPVKKTPIDPVQKDERKLYEKKSFEYYRKNAMDTMNQKTREDAKKDDSDNIERTIEKDKDNITKITEEIKKKNAK